MGGKTTQQTSTSTAQPWSAQQPYLQQGFQAAQDIYNKPGPGYFPQSTVANQSGLQTSAQNMGQQLGQNGEANMNMASGQNQKIMQGNYGDDVFKNIQSKVMPAVASQFEGSGRFGNNESYGTAASTALTNAYAPYASSMMNQALDRAPSYGNQQWQNIQNMNQLGGQQQQYNQMQTNDALARYNFNSQQPQLKLNQFMQNVGGNWGNTTTASQPVYQPGIGQQLLGGLLAGGSLFG